MFEIFEHTADFGIRARAGSRNELFADAARGLFSLMVANLDAVAAVDEMRFQLAGDDCEALLHDWLAELLFAFSTRRLVFIEFEVNVTDAGLSAVARGELIDPKRHEIDVEVKAITWHALAVENCDDEWLAEIIVDV